MKQPWRNVWLLTLCAISVLAMARTVSAQTTLVSTGAVWKYLDDGSDPGPTWFTTGFSDSGWLSGPAELGFGDGGEVTTNTSGHIAYFYRLTFNVADASSITNLRAVLKRDDGAIVYLNGTEVIRDNMPPGSITPTTLAAATAGDDGATFSSFSIDPAALVSGDNLIAVQVHQAATTSSDVSFDLGLVGNPTPSIAITSPTNSQVIRGSTINISGTAVPGGANIVLVEAFAGNTKVGESTNGAFTINWSSAPLGTNILTAKITDSSGLTATSAPVEVVVEALPASILVIRGSTWKILDGNVEPASDWRQLSYNDSTWKAAAPGPLGGGDPHIVTTVDYGPSGGRYPSVYYRRTFNVSSAQGYQGLTVRLLRDDGAAVWLNGTLLVADGTTAGAAHADFATQTVDGANESTYFEFSVPSTALVNGQNVLAVMSKQVNATSSDLGFDLELEGSIDTSGPTVTGIDPIANSTVLALNQINIVFNEAVAGVNASDLMINGEPASSVTINNPNDYTFFFPQPATGQVQVAWSSTHGITDTAPLANPFAGGSWTYNLDPNASAARFIINEFMADNENGVRDEAGVRNDWIEIANIGPLAGNLAGYYLTDESTNLMKWRFPSVSVNANGYLLVWASSENRTNDPAALHTNFKLGKSGGYLALVNPMGMVVSEFNPYPPQTTDISYGRTVGDPTSGGFFPTPTPRAQNSTSGSGFAPTPVFSVDTGIYTNATLSVAITAPSGTIRYTLNGTIPTASSPLYSAPLTIGTNVTVKARVFPAGGSGLLPGEVVAKNYIFLDGSSMNFTSNLPLMIISTEGRAIPQDGIHRTNGSFTIIDVRNAKTSLRSPTDFQVLADFEHFGQTSIGFAKKPVRVETQDALGNDLKVSILGMPASSDYRIRNPYDDKSMLNDFLAAEYWEQMGHYSTRRRFVEAFVDQGGGRLTSADYYGIMVIMETIQIDDDRLNLAKIPNTATNEPTISGGYIFKKDKDSTGDLGWTTAGGNGFGGIPLKMHDPKPNDLRTVPYGSTLTPAGQAQLNYLRNYINQMEKVMYSNTWLTATGTNHYSHYIDQDSFVDFHWVIEFTKQIDGYRISNYMHKDRNGKIKAGPVWDFNLAFGNANYLLGGQTNGWYYDQLGDVDHTWLRRMITGSSSGTASNGDPDFTQKIADRWAFLRTNIFNNNTVLARIDELSIYLNEAAKRDFAKYNTLGIYLWPNPDGGAATAGSSGSVDGRDVDYVRPLNYYGAAIEPNAPSPSSGSIIGQMKKYMNGRFLWIDSQFTRTPSFSSTPGQVTNGYVVTISGAPGVPIYYTLNGTDPRGPLGTTNGTLYTGPITVSGNVEIVARARSTTAWKGTWSGPARGSFYTSIPALRISEIMYNPAPAPAGSTNSNSDYEYIEVKNIGGTPLNVNRFSLGGGISFQFPNVVLSGGQSAVVVRNLAAFQSRYGTNNPSILVLGVFTGGLKDSGDQIVLKGGLNEPILDFSYSDKWYPSTDGLGFSLVTVDDNAARSDWNLASQWRPSGAAGGSPGQSEPVPSRPGIVVNEVLANTPNGADAIELYNPTASPVNIGGWFLSDNFDVPKKYTIPANTIIAANGYIVFYETNSFNFPSNAPTSFALKADGDDVWLFSGDGVNLTGYAHGFDFGASPLNSTIGRYVISTGADHLVAQQFSTLGAANSGPLVGPIVITEINARPTEIGFSGQGYNNTQDEFIELRNISGSPVDLYHPASPSSTWRLRDAVSYNFPATNVTVPAGGYIMVVGFNPADSAAASAFRSRNGVPANVPLFGPWSGDLGNDGDSVELARPDVYNNGFSNILNYVLVDKVNYDDEAPWPNGWDGTGLTLQRVVESAYGNDPANWTAVAPSPGATANPTGTAPAITSQPTSQNIPTGRNATLSVTATGSQPLRYQWFRNNVAVAGATNSILSFTNFQATQAGDYNIFVYNSAGSALGTPFTITTRTGVQITQNPVSRTLFIGGSTNFTVVAVGSGMLSYQWYLNGMPISATNMYGADTSTLVVSNAQEFNAGTVTVKVTDDYETIESEPVDLVVGNKMLFTVHPIGQAVVQGQSVTLTVAATGTPPYYFRWRRQNGFQFPVLQVETNYTGYSYFVITNFQSSNAATYSVAASNVFGLATLVEGGFQTGLSSNAVLTVLADADQDGLPDSWETGRAGFNVNDPSDAARDDDGDGMSNKAEYIAGTDYSNNQSYLKVLQAPGGGTSISFLAVSNRTYSVLSADSLGAPWQKTADVLAYRTNRITTVTDPAPANNRFYRLVTPIQP